MLTEFSDAQIDLDKVMVLEHIRQLMLKVPVLEIAYKTKTSEGAIYAFRRREANNPTIGTLTKWVDFLMPGYTITLAKRSEHSDAA